MVIGTQKKTIIKLNNVSCYYYNFLAVKDVSLEIEENKITALIGPSGCGKSTVLRTLNRMNDTVPGSKVTGEVIIQDLNIYKNDLDLIELRRNVGMVFQRPFPFPMSVYDNIAYGPRMHGIKKKSALDEIIEHSLKQSAIWDEIKDKLDKSAYELSGGQQQRLCIARALAVEPQILLLDEPCSALDPIATLKIEDLLNELKKELTIVIVTHNMQQASRISDNTAFFWTTEERTGFLVEYDATAQIFSSPTDKRTEDYITGRFG
ncbi:MAG: phosphate ABC transporter ATP-binding protein [Candidatus Melainabacteria bacterium]|nr:phosphate ABC transporter ATP-binding protein [Candidatus Melainabacteria bacterium]MBI3309706.1 phosphate ABC transporter ATP-binding protein [Candidatus Melainabacteria bacterium]